MWLIALVVLVGFCLLAYVVNEGFAHLARAIAIHARAVKESIEGRDS